MIQELKCLENKPDSGILVQWSLRAQCFATNMFLFCHLIKNKILFKIFFCEYRNEWWKYRPSMNFVLQSRNAKTTEESGTHCKSHIPVPWRINIILSQTIIRFQILLTARNYLTCQIDGDEINHAFSKSIPSRRWAISFKPLTSRKVLLPFILVETWNYSTRMRDAK